jgi:transposase
MRYIGLDVHKENTTACFISAGGKVLMNFEVPSNADGLATILELMENTEHCVMMESSTYSYHVYRYFDDLGIETYAVHAASLKVVTQSSKKTDKKDAELIGRYLRLWKREEIEISMSFIPTREQCALKDVCRYREEISKKTGDESRRIKAHLKRNCMDLPEEFENLHTKKTMNFIRKTWPDDKTLIHRLGMYEELLKEGKRLEKEVTSQMKKDTNVDILADMMGIGRQTAVQLMSMIIDIKRFPTPEKLCAYFGMVPKVHDSGGKQHHGKMTKKGDKMMRMIMERVTQTHVQHCSSAITEYYERKVKEMGVKKALITASRKMLTVIHALLTKQESFKAQIRT